MKKFITACMLALCVSPVMAHADWNIVKVGDNQPEQVSNWSNLRDGGTDFTTAAAPGENLAITLARDGNQNRYTMLVSKDVALPTAPFRAKGLLRFENGEIAPFDWLFKPGRLRHGFYMAFAAYPQIMHTAFADPRKLQSILISVPYPSGHRMYVIPASGFEPL